MSTQNLSDEEKTRREKLGYYLEKGINPYRNGLTPKHSVQQLRERWGELYRHHAELCSY